MPRAGAGLWCRGWRGALVPDDGDKSELRLALANELAVGASSRDAADNLDVDPTTDLREAAEAPLASFLAPMLPTASVLDGRLDAFVPSDETTELGRGLPVALPARDPTFEERMLLRLVLVVPVPTLLLLLLVVLNVGNGDLARDEGALEANEALVLFVGIGLLPVATAGVGRAGAAVDFLAGTKDGEPFSLAVGSVTLPRFHTFCTKDLAEERNPNLEGLGLGF